MTPVEVALFAASWSARRDFNVPKARHFEPCVRAPATRACRRDRLLLPFAALAVLSGCILAGPMMRPAAKAPFPRTPEKLERGRYLVENVMACAFCHSQHDWTKFLGPEVPGTEYAGGVCLGPANDVNGDVCTQNLTSHPDGLGNWTDDEIVRAVREGVSRDGRALFPFHPYQRYAVMSDDDAQAMVVYLRSLPPRPGASRRVRLHWPTSWLVNLVPRPAPVPQRGPRPEDRLERGRYLTELAACDHCHTKQPRGMRESGRDFAGGFVLTGPWGKVVTPNISPHPTGLARFSRDEFISRFKSFLEVDTDSPALPAGATVMPWVHMAGITEEDLGLIHDFLATQRPVENQVAPFGQDPEARAP